MADRCGAVILAGGRGERMGERNKAELCYQGRSFKNRILDQLGGLGLPCFFSAGAYPAEEDGTCPVIQDLPVPGAEGAIGPMGGDLVLFSADGLRAAVFCVLRYAAVPRGDGKTPAGAVDAGFGCADLADG